MRSDGPPRHRVLLGGGIGAGKTSVASLFVTSGWASVEGDRVGAEILEPGTEATAAVADVWPDVVVDGVVDRANLASIVFVDPGALKRLESITHPAIVDRIVADIANSDQDVIVETPVMRLDIPGHWVRVAVVADEDVRISRAAVRGGDPEDVRNRIASQPSGQEWSDWADVTIDNSGAWEDTERTVLAWIRGLES